MEAGFFANGHGRTNYYGPGSENARGRGADGRFGNTDHLLNTRLTGAQVNQVYLSMGKAVDGRRGLDIGGTVDFTWGSDAYIVQSKGLEFGTGHGSAADGGRWGKGDYFASFAQAYVEAAYGDWNFIAGKFYAPFGSNPYRSDRNFFYSWTPTASIAPHVGGGAYASYKASKQLTLVGGWVMPDEIGESSKNNAVLGGIIWAPSKNFNLLYAFAAGKNKYERNDFGGCPTDLFVNSIVATTQISTKLKYVFEWTLLNASPEIAAGTKVHLAAYGFNNELIYQYNKRWAFGTRFGMLNLNDAFATTERGYDWYTVSLGANWTPNAWLTLKPEVRYDWVKGDGDTVRVFNPDPNFGPDFGIPRNTYQVSGGMSAVVKF